MPAATEILAFLNLDDRLVGVSSDCDWPESVEGLPSLSHTDIDESASSRSIDRQVRQQNHTGSSLYHLDVDRLESLKPGLVLTQEQCDVCAPSFETVRKASRSLPGDPEILSLEATTLDQVLETILSVGTAAGEADRAKNLRNELRERQQRLSVSESDPGDRPRVACVEWYDPPFKAGHWVPRMVSLTGGKPLGKTGAPSGETTLERLANFEPEHLVLMPCGFGLERTVRDGRDFLSKLKARTSFDLEKTRVHAVNGGWYFSRPGPRLWDGLAIMWSILHPGESKSVNCPNDAVKRLA